MATRPSVAGPRQPRPSHCSRIVIPVKPFRAAKQRLATLLSPAERSGLAEAMLRDVLDGLDRDACLASTVVVTNDPLAARLATAAGAEVREDIGRSYNELVRRIARDLEREGAEAVAIVPADLPLLAAEDLAMIGQLVAERAVLLAPDRHGDGTNLLALSPPTVIEPSYGPGSFDRHRRAASATGARIYVSDSRNLGLDVDTPDDLAELARRCESAQPHVARATRAFLERTAAVRAL